MEEKMKTAKTVLLGAIVLSLGVAAWAQEFPRFEAAADYSYARYVPSANNVNNYSLNGGGGSFDVNFTQYLGIKVDLQGYNSNTNTFRVSPGPNFPNGVTGQVSGNLFTYLFGPQIKFRLGSFHPFFHALYGGAHSNVYGTAFNTLCQPIAGTCSFKSTPSGNAFAMAYGGGLDLRINKSISLRPAEIDYLYTKFSNQFTNTNQNNFRYSAGVVFTFGGSQ
jgi:hypothetical protein